MTLQISLAAKTLKRVTQNIPEGNLEALLNGLENLLVLISSHERDGETLGTETTGTTDTVKVRVGVRGHVVVDGEVDALDIDTTTEDISGNADALVELLEFLVSPDTAAGQSST